MSGTENDILSNVPGLESDDDTDDTNQGTSTTEGSSSSDSGQEAGSTTSEGSGTNAPKLDQPPVVRRHDGLVERQDELDPRTRALVDPATGQVVARGGIERRIFEKAQHAERQLAATTTQLQQAQAQMKSLQDANSAGNQLRLQPEQQVMAMRVMSDFLRDPVATVEYMIAEVKAKGYNLPSLNGAGGQSDMRAFQQMLDERLAPIMQGRQQQERAQQAEVKAKETLDNFLAGEPDARANLDIMAHMIQQDQSLSLESAYIRMMKWCMSERLDPTQPIGPQLQSRRQQTEQPGLQPRQQTRPLPNGRQMNGQSAPVERRAFDENSEWSAIIRQSMIEAGL